VRGRARESESESERERESESERELRPEDPPDGMYRNWDNVNYV